jgi:hypothetical protein
MLSASQARTAEGTVSEHDRYERIAGEWMKRKIRMRSERNFILGRRNIILLEDLEVPARPSDKGITKVKTLEW